jgi:hypothetical protein
VLVATTKLAGSVVRAHVDNHAIARRLADLGFAGALMISVVLLLRSTAEMQAVYLAIASGGTSTALPTSVFFVVTLFVAVASAATGFWTCSPLAERVVRLERSARRAWRRRRRAARRLDARETAIGRLLAQRRHLLAALRELECEQLALAQARLAGRRDANWPLYGLADASSPTTEEVRTAAGFASLGTESFEDLDASFTPRSPRLRETEHDHAPAEAGAGEQRAPDPAREAAPEPAPEPAAQDEPTRGHGLLLQHVSDSVPLPDPSEDGSAAAARD